MEKWQACEDSTLNIDQFIGRSCIQACDLARKTDLNSKVRLFCKTIDGEKHWYCISPQFWIPHDTAFNNENKALGERYKKYISLGALSVTDGGEIDYHAVLESILSSHSETFSMTVALDPNGASFLGLALMGHGVDVTTVTQNYTNFSEPMKELENAINSGRFHHDGNPVMTWNISNVVGKRLPGNDDTVRPINQTLNDKVDGAIALIMAIGEAMYQVRHSEPKENNIDKYQFTDINFKLIPSVFTDDEQIHLKLFAKTGVLSKEDVRQMAIHYGIVEQPVSAISFVHGRVSD
jgi:phage terminase large subunit-like protein